MRISRRGLLTGGGIAASAVVAGGVGVEQGWLPGRPYVQERLGLNGSDGHKPDVATGPVERGSFASDALLGAETSWVLLRPPGTHLEGLPLVVALHGAGGSSADFLPGGFGVAEWLAAVVADGTPPYAVLVPDGARTYWHPQPDGTDTGAMVVEDLLPRIAERGLRCSSEDRIGFIGWSMGGYGALRLAGLLGADRVAAVVASSPAVDAAGVGDYDIRSDQATLDGIAVDVECGTGDPFYRPVQDYVDGFAPDADVIASFEPGAHDGGYWLRTMPDQLHFLGTRVASGA